MTFPEMVRDADSDLLHRVRNFGEKLFHEFEGNSLGSVDLSEVDRTTRSLVVKSIQTRNLGRVTQLLKRLSDAEFPDRTPDLTRERESA